MSGQINSAGPTVYPHEQCIGKVLTISTAHIRHFTDEGLKQQRSVLLEQLSFMSWFGGVAWLHHTACNGETLGTLKLCGYGELADLLRWCDTKSFEYLVFDSDDAQLAGAPVFDW